MKTLPISQKAWRMFLSQIAAAFCFSFVLSPRICLANGLSNHDWKFSNLEHWRHRHEFCCGTGAPSAISVKPGFVYRVDFDYSADPHPPYDQIYILLDLESMNPGESFRLTLYDDEATLIQSADILNDGTFTDPGNGSHDFPMWGQSFFPPLGSAFNDSKGFWLIEGLTGAFTIVSAQTEISQLAGWNSPRVEQAIEPFNVPALLSYLNQLVCTADLKQGTQLSLLASLRLINAFYDHDNSIGMITQLQVLQKKINTQVSREDSDLTDRLSQYVQDILDLLP